MATALIIYASLTGNTEEIADILAESLEDNGVEVDVKECTSATASDFLDYDICVVATYTYGTDGDLPDEIVDLYDELEEEDLTGKVYGALGSGDTFYDKFCQSVLDFDQQFAKTGATKGAENVLVDLNAEEEDVKHIEEFAKSLSEAVK
ncbi:flavodoxin [Granulicatella seriolae]|uniref:Flavodoxin n=1 Tax=Granulicatella seriolae TaxID=2967226 RepID=A0ABT1WLX8_9LACT|nr:flavodoxin [Granulicatella seriolae]